MPPTFILDAYNILREFVRPGEGERTLEEMRSALEARLRTFLSTCAPGTRILLVYDGARGVVPRTQREGGLEILFSRPPRKADDVVLDLCRRLEGTGDVHAVTSDLRDIGHRIQGLRLQHWLAKDFAEYVHHRTSGAGEPEGTSEEGCGKPETVSPEEAEAWVRRFGFGEAEGEVGP